MADTKVSDLTAATPASADLVYLVDEPSGTASSKQTTVQDLLATDALVTDEIDAAVTALPTLEPSEDIYTRLGTWDDSVGGVVRPVPNRDVPVRVALDALVFFQVLQSSTTETSLLNSTQTIAANEWEVGSTVSLVLLGYAKNDTASGANTMTIRVELNAVDIATFAVVVPQSATAGNSYYWRASVDFQWQELTGSRLAGNGVLGISDEGGGTQNEVYYSALPASVFDLTASMVLDITAQHSVNHANTKCSLSSATMTVSQDPA